MSLTTDSHVGRGAPDHVRRSLTHLHRQLEQCVTLEPSPVVNGLFGQLVELVISTPEDRAAHVMGDAAVRALQAELRALCAEGERQLEFAWAARVAASPSPSEELALFPYLANYQQLVDLESEMLTAAATTQIRCAAFVGAGPLPLTALLLEETLCVPIDSIDRDPSAVIASRRVAHALGATNLQFYEADGCFTDFARYDLVVLAALVGSTPSEKQQILRHMATSMRPGAMLLARSARGLRTLLYPAIDPSSLADFDVRRVVHPTHEVINSVILARAR